MYRFMDLSPLEGNLLEGRGFVGFVSLGNPPPPAPYLECYLYIVGTREILTGGGREFFFHPFNLL